MEADVARWRQRETSGRVVEHALTGRPHRLTRLRLRPFECHRPGESLGEATCASTRTQALRGPRCGDVEIRKGSSVAGPDEFKQSPRRLRRCRCATRTPYEDQVLAPRRVIGSSGQHQESRAVRSAPPGS